jgi:hypothetical protein
VRQHGISFGLFKSTRVTVDGGRWLCSLLHTLVRGFMKAFESELHLTVSGTSLLRANAQSSGIRQG